MSAFDDFLADVGAERCWLLELDAFSLAALSDGSDASGAFADAAFSEVAFCEGDSADSTTLYYSSHGFTSQAADAPADTWYDARLSGDIQVDRHIAGSDGIGGLARTFAEAVLVNADGGLDSLQEDYALDGRPARLLIGRPTDARSAFGLVFSGVVQQVDDADTQRLRLKLSDGVARLDVPVNPTTYAGTGGLEGGDDLAGKPKPKCWGNAKNVPAPLVVAASLIYQVHDGEISDVPAVYDRGVALTQGADYSSQADMEANAPSAGQYRVWKEGGCFRLGATPDGTVTADVLGDAEGGYVDTTGPIVQRLLLTAAIDSSLVDSASFTQLAADAPAEVGDWVGTEPRTVREQVERFLAGVGAYGGFSRLGLFTVGVVKLASGTPAASFSEEDILALRRGPLPAAVEPVVWRARVAWQRNYTVQTDLAASVSSARRTFAAQPERVAVSEDTAVKSRRRLAREYGPTGNLYADQADADTEALRLRNLWKDARGLYLVTVPASGIARDLGDVVTLEHSRYGFAAGRDTRVLGHAVKGRTVELMVLA